MDFSQIKELDDAYVMQTYGRNPLQIVRGEGSVVYDETDKAYVDFASGIGVVSVGHANPKWTEAVMEQAMKLGHVSNLYYTQPNVRLAQQLCQRAGMDKVFFANSGAESNEGIIKLARKYSFDKYGKGRGTILTLRDSFHGRTMAALTATGQDKFHNYFFPFPDGFRYAEASMDGIAEVAGHDVCAVLVELVQGEGGVYPLKKEFVHDLAVLCAERDWLLLVDEVQTGVGRTGSLFAYQQFGILPDAVSFAKGIGGGLPLGGFMTSEKCSQVLTPGTHGSTYGGNPVSCAAALAVLDILDEDTISAVKDKGLYLRNCIDEMKLPCLGETRGMGLMIGIEVKGEYTNVQLSRMLMEGGLLTLTAGPALRLLPPLTITQKEMEQGLAIMKNVLGGL